MASHEYDPVALSQFVEQHDLYGFRQVSSPPPDIKKADQVRREPNASVQWLLGALVFLVSSMLGGFAAFAYVSAVKGVKPEDYQNYVQSIGLANNERAIEVSIMLGVNALAAAILYWVVVRISARRPVYELTGPGSFKEFAYGLLGGTILICIIIGILFGLGHYKVDSIQLTPGLLLALFIGIGPAFAEEVIFRGFVLRLLDKAIGSLPAIAITSLAFGLLHTGNKYVSVMQAVLLGISAGLLLGACYYLTRRLWLAMGLHLSWNFVQGGIFNSDVSGNGYSGGLLKASFSGPEYLTGGKMGIEGSVISIGLTIVVGLIFLFVAHKRGHLNGRIGWNAPRINLLGSVPRLEIWAADGGWRPLPTAEELDAMLAPLDEDDPDYPRGTAPTKPAPATEPTRQDSSAPAPIREPSGDPFSTDPQDEVDALLPPEDATLTGELPKAIADEGLEVSPEDKTEQFAPVTLDSEPTIKPEVSKDHPDWPSDAEMEAVTAKSPEGPPTITKVSSSVTAVKGTGTGKLTDADLDSTQQMDAVAEIEMTDQIKPIQQTKITEENNE